MTLHRICEENIDPINDGIKRHPDRIYRYRGTKIVGIQRTPFGWCEVLTDQGWMRAEENANIIMIETRGPI